jgi:hypothetical protein
MIETFTRDGVRFKYPNNWILEDDADGASSDWTVSLQTPHSAIYMVSYRPDTDPTELADETLDALLDDYADLESTATADEVAGRVALGYDIDFITLDVTVNAQLRTLPHGDAAVLIMWQMADRDRAHYESLMAAVTKSLTLS